MPLKVLFIEPHADGLLDIAMRAQAAGHHAIYYVHDFDRWKRPTGMGLVERVTDWRNAARSVDLIVLGAGDYCMHQFDALRQQTGVPIVGGSVESAKWEGDRLYGMSIFKKAGIPTPPVREFTDYATAIKYVEKTGEAYACKPCWDGADKSLSYVGKSPEDMIYMLDRWRRKGPPKGTFILQTKVKGIEVGVGAWHGKQGWAGGWEENFECKKLFPGDLGPNTGEMGCYSEDTEVLTRDGWKFWPEVVEGEELATLTPEGRLEYEVPSALVEYQVQTTMIGWQNRSVDVLVTPNHNMLVASQWSARGDGEDDYRLVKAEDCTQSQYAIKRTAEWLPCRQDQPMVFPMERGQPEIVVDPIAWARFLGIYVAEGNASGGQVLIAASHPEKSQKVGAIIDATGLRFYGRGNGYTINSSRIARHLRPLGRAWEKFVPDYIREGSVAVIEAFLEGYALGDGNMQPNGFRVFYTSSKRLADDVQELLLKIGRLGIVKTRMREGVRSMIAGRAIHTRRLAYEVIERPRKLRSWLDKRDRYEVPYVGKVYCAEVSNHTLFVRRNGKPMWCGNTVMRYVARSRLADKVLRPLGPLLERLGYVGNIDVNCIIDEDGTPWPLEFTMRCGWPSTNIEMELFNCDPVEFWYGLVRGSVPRNHHSMGVIAVGVVLAIPDFPYSHATAKETVGIPIYGLTPSLAEHWHPAQTMKGEQTEQATAGDYVGICAGVGDTVRAARRQVYSRLKRIELPSSPFFRVDIGERLRQHLPQLQAHGYAAGLDYA